MITETPEDPALIRERMQQIRLNLPTHFGEVRRDVQNLTDWKFYVRQHPAIVLSLVALTTFALVPKKAKPLSESSNSLATMLPWNRQQREQEVAKKSWLAGVLSVVAGLALKSATSYATGRMSHALGDLVTHRSAATRPEGGPKSPYF